MTGETIVDKTPPIVKPDDENLAQGVPEGEVGSPYRVFEASAYDALDGKLDPSAIDVKVLSTDGQTPVGIENGCFTPDETGTYTIRYSISDSSGNTGTYDLLVTIRAKLADLQITVENNTLRETCSVGETVAIPQKMTVRGGAGAYKTSITVTDRATGEALEVPDGSIVFEKQGYYEVAYRAEDYIGNVAVQKYFLLAEGRTQPYVDEPSMPAAVLAGKPFTFPAFTATDYNSYAGKPVAAEKYYEVTSDDWESKQTYREGDVFTPSEGEYRFRVCAENIADPSQKYIGEEGRFSAVRAVNIGEYLCDVTGAVKADYSANEEYPRYIVNRDTSLEFLNLLSAETFYLTFTVPSGLDAFGAIEVRLRDYASAAQDVTISIEKQGDRCEVLLNGERTLSLNTAFTGTSFEVYLSNGFAYINATLIADLGTMFSSGKVYLSVGLRDVTGQAGIELRRVNNQTYLGLFEEDENFDVTAPVVVAVRRHLSRPLCGRHDRRSRCEGLRRSRSRVLRLPARAAQRGGDPRTGRGGRGRHLCGSARRVQDRLYGCGRFGNTANAIYTVKVFNRADPVLNVEGAPPAHVSLGDSVSVPGAAAADFAGEELDVFVYVIDPDNYMRQADSSFTAEKEGTYIVRYYCCDGYGCYTIRDYYVEVLGGEQ